MLQTLMKGVRSQESGEGFLVLVGGFNKDDLNLAASPPHSIFSDSTYLNIGALNPSHPPFVQESE